MEVRLVQAPVSVVRWRDLTLSVRVHFVVRDGDARFIASRVADFVEVDDVVDDGSDVPQVRVKLKASNS
jgi:hypothetical protein